MRGEKMELFTVANLNLHINNTISKNDIHLNLFWKKKNYAKKNSEIHT